MTRIVKLMHELAKRRQQRHLELAPGLELKPCRKGTKQSILIDLLARKEGATMKQLTSALSKTGRPWTEDSVRSGLHWDVHSVKGYGVRSELGRNGQMRYRLVLPKGVKAPLPHVD